MNCLYGTTVFLKPFSGIANEIFEEKFQTESYGMEVEGLCVPIWQPYMKKIRRALLGVLHNFKP